MFCCSVDYQNLPA